MKLGFFYHNLSFMIRLQHIIIRSSNRPVFSIPCMWPPDFLPSTSSNHHKLPIHPFHYYYTISSSLHFRIRQLLTNIYIYILFPCNTINRKNEHQCQKIKWCRVKKCRGLTSNLARLENSPEQTPSHQPATRSKQIMHYFRLIRDAGCSL